MDHTPQPQIKGTKRAPRRRRRAATAAVQAPAPNDEQTPLAAADEQIPPAPEARQDLTANIEDLLARWERSVAAGEAAAAELRDALGSGSGSVATWQATLASAEEALGNLQATIAKGRDSLVAWQATIARGESSVEKAEGQFTHAMQALAGVQADLQAQHEEFAQELNLGREVVERWQASFNAGGDWVEEWKRSTAAWQQSLRAWNESSSRLLGQWTKLFETQAAKPVRRGPHRAAGIALLVALLLIGIIAGYGGARWLSGLLSRTSIPVSAVEVPAAPASPAPVPQAGPGRPVTPAAAPVVEPLPPAPAPPAPAAPAPTAPASTVRAATVVYRVQVGAFRQRENADTLVRQLAAAGFRGAIRREGALFKVQVGGYSDRAQAEASAARVRGRGFAGAYVIEESR
ncbi:MAG TPA: SPOR domain-containing protein [bacterium]|nr:SPOR domain-containing protein [bacterium]